MRFRSRVLLLPKTKHLGRIELNILMWLPKDIVEMVPESEQIALSS